MCVVGVKDSVHELKICILEHLCCLPCVCFKGSSLLLAFLTFLWEGMGREQWELRGWKCILQFAVQDWSERVGRGRAGMCRGCSEGRVAESACSEKVPVITTAAELD